MELSDALLEKARPFREKVFGHPFVLGIGEGSLAVEKFRFYLRQDYLYLIEYCRVFGLAVAKAEDLADMARMATLLNATLGVEMELHRSYCEGFGISREALEQTSIAPITRAYTNHLLAVAWRGSLAEIAASLVPCQWDYWEIGRDLAERGGLEENNPYRQWVAAYASPEYRELAEWLRSLLDRLGKGLGRSQLDRIEEVFLDSSRYELMFWDMAWQGE
jgi:thiaminase/transcriptional activator TenA